MEEKAASSLPIGGNFVFCKAVMLSEWDRTMGPCLKLVREARGRKQERKEGD